MFSAAAMFATCFVTPMPLASLDLQTPSPGVVEAAAQAGPARPLSEAELARSSGRAGFDLTVGSVILLADGQARLDFRGTGEVARTEMDLWWGTTGAQLIATSIRAAGATL